jgi:UPF0716 protein FxsA
LFIVVPLLELAALIWIGRHVGALPTIAGVLLVGVVGAALVRYQAVRIWGAVGNRLSQGVTPEAELIDGLLVLVAGVLLLTPGLLTDIAAILLLVPFVRKFVRRWVSDYFRKRFVVQREDKGEIIDAEWREVKSEER